MEGTTKLAIAMVIIIISVIIAITLHDFRDYQYREKMASLGYCQKQTLGTYVNMWDKCQEAK
jgi:hypothetical protein